MPQMTRAGRALFALFAVVAPLCFSAPLKKRSGIDTTMRLGRFLSPSSLQGSSMSSSFSVNAAGLDDGKFSQPTVDPFSQRGINVFRPFSLGGSGAEGRQADRPLAGAFRIYTPLTRAAAMLRTAVDKAPDPGTLRTLASPNTVMKPREKQTTKLWTKLDSKGEPVEASTSVPSTSGSTMLEAAHMVDQNIKAPKQPTEHVKPSWTPWSFYRSNYFKHSPPKVFYRNVFMPQASNRLQERIEALQAAKIWLMTQPSSYRLSRAESGLLTITFKDWRSFGIRVDTARKGIAHKAAKDVIRQANKDRLSIIGLEDLLQKIASNASQLSD